MLVPRPLSPNPPSPAPWLGFSGLWVLANSDFRVWAIFLPHSEIQGNLTTPRDWGALQDSWKVVWPWLCPFHAWPFSLTCEDRGSIPAAILYEWEFALRLSTPKSVDWKAVSTVYLPGSTCCFHLISKTLLWAPYMPDPRSLKGQTAYRWV